MDEILDAIKTTEDRDELLIDIDEFEKTRYLSKAGGEKEFQKIKPENQEIIRSYLTLNNSSNALGELKGKLIQLEVVRIVLSFEPEESTINALSQWSRENLDRSALVYIEVDKTIGAGVVVTYKGKYVSNTIEDKLDEYFETNKDSLLSKIKGNSQQINQVTNEPIN